MEENRKIEIIDLSYSYADGTKALQNIDLELPLAERTVLLGANGCGKTTLLHHLNGLIIPEHGSIRINGREITKSTADDIRRNVGLLFDNPDNQVFSPTVAADVSFGPLNLHMKKDEVKRRVQEALQAVRIGELAEKSPYNLSLGQKKRCAIAGLLAMKPEILLMDEPFSGLDPLALQQFLEILQNLYEQGVAQIMSTHDVDVAYTWAKRVVVMKAGRILASGGIELMENEELMKDAGLVVPSLVKIFMGCSKMPHSIYEANQYIQLLENK